MAPYTPGDLAHARQVAVDVAQEAAEVAMGYFHRGVPTEEKGDRDLVSEADRQVEALIQRRLADAFPDDAIVGEEGIGTLAVAPAGLRRWYVDPIDGTTNFLKGLHHWGVSVGLAGPGDELLAGAIVMPRLGEVYSAASGQGATSNGVTIHASTETRLDRVAVAYAHAPRSAQDWGGRDRIIAGYAALSAATLARRMQGCSVADLAAVASGRIDATWAGGMSPWDVAAGLVIAQEAGAMITAPDGTPVHTVVGAFLAGPPAVHAHMRALITGEDVGQ